LKKYGEFHFGVIKNQNNLALIYKALGKYDLAINLFEKSLTGLEINFPANHPSISVCKSNLANVSLVSK
jgi:tetratricopeptide (TPR) repeat protein